jgi:hypothetical protein
MSYPTPYLRIKNGILQQWMCKTAYNTSVVGQDPALDDGEWSDVPVVEDEKPKPADSSGKKKKK